jgi:membrane protein YqaA with SNARE-associated domain
MGFGATGFVTLGLGVPALPLTLVYAAVAGVVGGALGFGIGRIRPRTALVGVP